MSGVRVRSRLSSRRPVHASRAVEVTAPIELPEAPVRRWPAVVTGVLCAVVLVEFVVGLVVIWS